MSETRKSVDSETLLSTYVELYNKGLQEDGTSTSTFTDVALALDMTVENVYQRVLKIRKDLTAQGVTIPLMKRSNDPRKTVKRVSLTNLLSIAKELGVNS